jgi:hypothetical protein
MSNQRHESNRRRWDAGKLDKLASAAKVKPFSSWLAPTNLQFNMGEIELLVGMISTIEVAARDGVWTSANDPLAFLAELHPPIIARKPRSMIQWGNEP